MQFFLGTHIPSWLNQTDVPLFISHRRLRSYVTLPQPQGEWCLDSGGFSELSMFGKWTVTPDEYIEATCRYSTMGGLKWAAPQDWMCEPFILNKTGLTVEHHQWQTVDNYLYLSSTDLPFIPVLQGWTIPDYLSHVNKYLECGVDLTTFDIVGVGSVCRRQATEQIGDLFRELSSIGIRCHGFGVKSQGLKQYGQYLVSSDSMAWSYSARNNPPLEECMTHQNCANCITYALLWRDRLLAYLDDLPMPNYTYAKYESLTNMTIISQTETGARICVK